MGVSFDDDGDDDGIAITLVVAMKGDRLVFEIGDRVYLCKFQVICSKKKESSGES